MVLVDKEGKAIFTKEREGNLRLSQLMATHEFLANKRVLFLYGPIAGMFSRFGRTDTFSSSSIIDSMLAMSCVSSEPIYLIIDSEGGDVPEGLVLYDMMKTLSCPIYTIGKKCYSMAAIILSAGEKGCRYIFPHAKTMLHLPMGMTSGDAKEMEIQGKEMQKIKHMLIDILRDNGVNKMPKTILKDIDREHWMDSQEAIDYGIADEIVDKGFFDRFKNV